MEIVPILNLMIAGCIGFFTSFVQRKRGKVVSYTKAEIKAIENNFISLEELSNYHSNINWGKYSVLLVSLFCVLVSILFEQIGSTSPEKKLIFNYATLEMGIAGTILIFSDLIHMNGLSPVLSRDNKHRIVNSSIRSGLLSIGILLAGMQTFSILIDSSIMIILCAVELMAVIYFQWIRALDNEE